LISFLLTSFPPNFLNKTTSVAMNPAKTDFITLLPHDSFTFLMR
jgi:hypothetical protein